MAEYQSGQTLKPRLGRILTGLAAGMMMVWADPTAVRAQVVKELAENLTVSENFDSTGSNWTTLADAENLFIIQDGEYILQRKATNAPYAVISGYAGVQDPFRMMVALKIDKIYGDQGFAGIMFMMQPQGQGGFLVEINQDRKYRIRQIVSGAYKYLTGEQKDGGWIKHSAIREMGQYNTIEVRSASGNYDIYFNGKFAQTAVERGYRSGETGIIVGPATRAKSDFYYLFDSAETPSAGVATTGTVTGTATGDPDIITLTESIIALKTEINSLKEENDGLRKTLSAMRSGDAEQQVTVKNYEKQIKNLEAEIKKQDAVNDSLQRINNDLQKYKEMVGSNGSGDLVITLSKALKAEKEKNARLEQQLKDAQEQKQPSKPNNQKTQEQKPTEPEKKPQSTGTISLPVEN